MPAQCAHIKANGVRCGSPALRHHNLCFFHHRHHEELIGLNVDRARRLRNLTIALPAPEDANSIQISISQIIRLLLMGAIDRSTARTLFYGLQVASSNLSHAPRFHPFPSEVVTDAGDNYAPNPLITYEEEEEQQEEEKAQESLSPNHERNHLQN